MGGVSPGCGWARPWASPRTRGRNSRASGPTKLTAVRSPEGDDAVSSSTLPDETVLDHAVLDSTRGPDTVLVVDFGAQYAQLIARRVRECHVFSEIVPNTITAEEVKRRAPRAIILSGGPKSVYEIRAPSM